jgi:biofilm PGA synthesis N-glycosyltransferase PgaC
VSLETALAALLLFVGLYPVVSAGLWIGGALVFRAADESGEEPPQEGPWPGVTILVPAFNESPVIASCVRAALGSDYPTLEVLLFDDGSIDGTSRVAEEAAGGDPRLRVVRDEVNRGKATRLNDGLGLAEHGLVVVADADTHLHPQAVRRLAAHIDRSPVLAAVAGGPHVTNRRNFLCAMQVLEAASIIGLIRRTQAAAGRVGVVAGVLGIFRREAVQEVGGYDAGMATEDIDLTWRLLLAGWRTSYEPAAVVGMEVPGTLQALWAQRRRWARGQGEVLHAHLPAIFRWSRRGLWPMALEALSSLVWIVALAASAVVSAIAVAGGAGIPLLPVALAWGVATSVVAILQLAFALGIGFRHDPRAALGFALGPLFPLAYWLLSAAAALREELPAILRGPARDPVSWDIPRDLSASN